MVTVPKPLPILFISGGFVMTKPTIREVSRLSGVSVSTVSRVINGLPGVNSETKQRVWTVIERCGYTPNTNARHLKQISSNLVCIIVKGTQNLFFMPIVEAMQSELEKTRFTPLVHYIDESEDELKAAHRLILEKKAAGLIFLGGSPSKALGEIPIPCVLSTTSGKGLGLPLVSSVCIDDRLAAKEAVNYLFSQGHRKIAVLGGILIDQDSIYERYLGAIESFTEHGLVFDPTGYIESKFTLQDAYTAVCQFLGEHKDCTAIFAVSDIMAIAAIRAIFDSGLRVPDDISVLGFDGILLGRFFCPSLTTVRQPEVDIAQESVRLLIQTIEDPPGQVKNLLLNTTLLEGESVKSLLFS